MVSIEETQQLMLQTTKSTEQRVNMVKNHSLMIVIKQTLQLEVGQKGWRVRNGQNYANRSDKLKKACW